MSFKILSRPTLLLLVVAIAVASVPASKAQNSRSRYNRQAQNDQTWTVPDDTVILVSMNDNLSSKTSRVGDRFTATVTTALEINGETVIPVGAMIEGRVTQVKPARRMGKAGAIAVDFEDLVFPNGSRVSLVGNLTSDDPDTRRQIDEENRVSGEKDGKSAVFVGSSGAIGAVLGGILGGGRGAITGGILGAGAGAAAVLLSKGEEAYVGAGTPFGVQLRQPLVIRETNLDGSTSAIGPDNDPGVNSPIPADPRPQPSNREIPAGEPEPAQPEPVREPEVAPEPQPEQPAESLPPAENLPLSSAEMIRRSQLALKAEGYYEGPADGAMTPRFSAALKAFQRENKLPETGDLDPQTAKRLGVLSAVSQPARTETRPVANSRNTNTESNVVLANVISATARRTDQGAIYVSIETQANTGGWRWYGDSVVNGDTLEVYARAVRPTGMVTQALTRGRIDLTVRDNVEYVKRVVVHSANNDQVIALTAAARPAVEPANRTVGANASAINIQRQAEELLAEYQRISGVRLTGTSVEMDNRAGNKDAEIELLFAIDSFVNAAQLYVKMAGALQDRQSLRSATLAMARQARKTDRVISTSSSAAADRIALRWDAIRQDVLKLMQTFNISASELDQ